MTRYVSLSTDERPTYAVHAPIAIRLWKRLGYTAILHVHDDWRWESAFGKVVLAACAEAGAAIVRVATRPPMSMCATMRVVRLTAAGVGGVEPDDVVLMSDVDMYPLSRTFFANPPDFGVLRALYSAWLSIAWMNGSREMEWPKIVAGQWRFNMCYAVAKAGIWREVMPDIVGGNSYEALGRILGIPDSPSLHEDLDEGYLSYHFLGAKRAEGTWEVVGPGHWHKGELQFIEPLDSPLLSQYINMPRGLIGPYDRDFCQEKREGAIDFIPPRFGPVDMQWWFIDALKLYWPEEGPWMDHYVRTIEPTIAGFPWR